MLKLNEIYFIKEENTEKIELIIGATRTQKDSRKTNNSEVEVRVCKSFNKTLFFIDCAPNISLDDH